MKKVYLSVLLCLVLFSACATGIRIETYSAKEYAQLDYKEVIELIKTPEQAAHYLETCLCYANTNTRRSFKYIHQRIKEKEKAKALCAEYAFSPAAQLRDNGYPSLILYLLFEKQPDKDQKAHACFVYQNKKGKWGTLGVLGQNSLGAIFENLKEICYWMEKYYSEKIVTYTLHDFSDINLIDSPIEQIYSGKWGINGKTVTLNAKQK